MKTDSRASAPRRVSVGTPWLKWHEARIRRHWRMLELTLTLLVPRYFQEQIQSPIPSLISLAKQGNLDFIQNFT